MHYDGRFGEGLHPLHREATSQVAYCAHPLCTPTQPPVPPISPNKASLPSSQLVDAQGWPNQSVYPVLW